MTRARILWFSLAVLASSCGTGTESAPSTHRVTPAPPRTIAYSLVDVGDMEDAVDVVERSPSDSFVYVLSRRGRIEMWSRDGRQRRPVLDISKHTTTDSERGLLGAAFRPVDGKWELYLNHTNLEGDTVVSRIEVRDDGTFEPATPPFGTTILTIDQPYSNHNGGALAVGPDNMLYIGTGDGGSADDPERRALDLSSLLGKILRISPRADGYDNPDDNPFIGAASARGEVWSLGLRNPWRFDFDDEGNMWIADVGQNAWEEVNMAPATDGQLAARGANFGWSAYEGTHRHNRDVSARDAIDPVHEYPHQDGQCSVIGGAVGSTRTAPGREGWYFYGDFCSGRVRAIKVADGTTIDVETVASNVDGIVSVRATSECIYVVGGGTVRRLVSDGRP